MASPKFGQKKMDETKNYILEEINHNDLMSIKCKKTCKYLNYFEHLLILASVTITGCVSVSAFDSLLCVSVDITSSAVGIAITAAIKNYQSIIKKKKNKLDKMVSL